MFEVRLQTVLENIVDDAAIPERYGRFGSFACQWPEPLPAATGQHQSRCLRENFRHALSAFPNVVELTEVSLSSLPDCYRFAATKKFAVSGIKATGHGFLRTEWHRPGPSRTGTVD
jgi:hypothetical protein